MQQLIPYLDPDTDVTQVLHSDEFKKLLSSDLVYPNTLASLILTVHTFKTFRNVTTFKDFEPMRKVLEEDLLEKLTGTDRLWLLLTFVLLPPGLPPEEVPAEPLVQLVVDLTRRIQEENRDDFFRGPQGLFEKGFDIGLLPLGLTYGKLGLNDMEYLSEMIKGSRVNDLPLLKRCVRGLAAIGLYYPGPALNLLGQALANRMDRPELIEVALQALATIGVMHREEVKHFLFKIGADDPFRAKVQRREDASLVKRYVDIVGLYNVNAYGCLSYPRIREIVQSGYWAATECKDLSELVSRIAEAYIHLVLESNYRISEMIAQP